MGILGVLTFLLFLVLLASVQGKAYMASRNKDYTNEQRAGASIASWVLVAVIAVNGLWVIDTYVYKIPNPFGPPMIDQSTPVERAPAYRYLPKDDEVPPIKASDAVRSQGDSHKERLRNW